MTRETPPVTSAGELMSTGQLAPYFQPICSLQSAGVFGYESLIRGPAGSPLERPDHLFASAREEGCEIELELHCCFAAMRDFIRRNNPGRLFVNMSAAALLSLRVDELGDRMNFARRTGLLPSRIVIELTEHVRVGTDGELKSALAPLRAMGVGLALDDFGDGHSSLKQWTELKPDYVKIDKHFVKGIHESNEHLEILRVYMYVAERFQTELIAEGIEEAAELAVIRDLGIKFGQGYLIGRPAASPSTTIPAPVASTLKSTKIAVLPEVKRTAAVGVRAETFMIKMQPVDAETTVLELEDIFEKLGAVHAIAVVSSDRPLGLINRQAFLNAIGRPFQRELFGRRSCTMFMNDAPLVVERDTPVDSIFELMKGEDQRYLVDGFIICNNGKYAGVATGERVVRALTEFRVEAARHANPLTSLPGNIPICTHIGRLISRGSRFTACYFDLANFKPFNDVYGFWRGDEMIRLLAGTIVSHCDAQHDFVGHVGGDDFVVLFQSEDWRDRCTSILIDFNTRARELFDAEARENGFITSEDRRGNRCEFPLTTVIIGAVRIQPGDYQRPEDVATAAADAKRMAKQANSGIHVVPNPLAAVPAGDALRVA